jgi:rSAM/selenodomain-associated transferase 2
MKSTKFEMPNWKDRTIPIVIPVLNEAACIERTLENVRAQPGPKKIIVVDGGSSDDTRRVAEPLANRVLEAPRGRARQMNRGARAAAGDVLLFLHADTLLPPGGLAAIRRALADPTAEAGTFRLGFDRDAPLYRMYEAFTRLPWSRLCFGDRGLFVRRRVFETVGGFPDWPMFEDLELAHRLCERGGFRFLRERVTTSARRFEQAGRARQQLRNLYLWSCYLLGADPDSLTHLYPYRD